MEKKFVQFKRVGDTWPEKAVGSVDDMPLRHWERIQKVPRDKDRFEFIRLIDLEAKGAPDTKAEVPIVEDLYECPLCGLIAESEEKLVMHKTNIHA